MGRSRGNFHSNDEDPTQRSRRKKNSSSGENMDSGAGGQGTGDGKKALYHCNYCNKDISGRIRIKCAVCPDFDLCIECFSVGAEVVPHKSNHPYRVMDNLSFPLFCAEWNADDEILLLEGIEMYGLGNWAEVAEHVGTKSKEQCIDHYTKVYMNSPLFPLPDMSHVVGKNRKELLAMAKGHGEEKKGLSILGDIPTKEESPFSPARVKVEDSYKNGPVGRLTSAVKADTGTTSCCSTNNPATGAGTNAISNPGHASNGGVGGVKSDGAQFGNNVNGMIPRRFGEKGPTLIETSGFNPKRQEFDTEYDNDAEQLLAEMEFKETDTEEERELKLRILHFYSKRLDERKSKKDFILERNFLYLSPFEQTLSAEERALCHRYDVFMRLHSKEEHENLLQTVVAEHRILKRIQELQEARAAGCRTSSEAERYSESKRRREAEEVIHRSKESSQASLSSQVAFAGSDGKDSRAAGNTSSSALNDPDVMKYDSSDLLSENEKRLCSELRLPPPIYLRMQQIMSVEIFSGNISKKADAHHLFQMEPGKVDRIYDILVKKGIAPP
ncbi:hypothetical protein MLD38_009949 [Melastoma candidum]|uniref:Uncharacterized protein n=1 Tax=Melastoma candidum TaxID=119954 RepID=A0ACB9R043_9MYRT|nr:hypothetical protein MLD38_009949 [Melastoma candidum]